MDLKTFKSFYNLEEIGIEKLYTENNDLYMILDLNVYIELMANGCRPVIDMDMRHLFIFKGFKGDIKLENVSVSNYRMEDSKLKFNANNIEIAIDSNEIEVIENFYK